MFDCNIMLDHGHSYFCHWLTPPDNVCRSTSIDRHQVLLGVKWAQNWVWLRQSLAEYLLTPQDKSWPAMHKTTVYALEVKVHIVHVVCAAAFYSIASFPGKFNGPGNEASFVLSAGYSLVPKRKVQCTNSMWYRPNWPCDFPTSSTWLQPVSPRSGEHYRSCLPQSYGRTYARFLLDGTS